MCICLARTCPTLSSPAPEVRGANFEGSGVTLTQLYSTASYQAHNLTGTSLGRQRSYERQLCQRNSHERRLRARTLTGAAFAGADVLGANLPQRWTRRNLARELYSAASYVDQDLTGIGLGGSDLTNGNFANVILTNAGSAAH